MKRENSKKTVYVSPNIIKVIGSNIYGLTSNVACMVKIQMYIIEYSECPENRQRFKLRGMDRRVVDGKVYGIIYSSMHATYAS